MNPLPRWLRGASLALVGILVGGLLFLSAMDRDLNHDEHQFLAPGILLSREGLLPYRDFPMFHLPNLVFIYAAMDRLTHQPIFCAKLLNSICSTGAAILIFAAGTSTRRDVPLRLGHLWLSAAAVLLLLTDQLFTYTAGKTWNHELPAFLLVAAIFAHLRGVERGALGWFAMSGACVGLAIGTRLTYAPVAAAFPILIAIAPLPRRPRALAMSLWIGCCVAALAPSLYFLIADHDRFIFDNLKFPRLRLEDLADTRAQKTMVWWRKLRYFSKEILAHSVPLAATFLLAGILSWGIWRKAKVRPEYGFAVCAAILPFVLFGCFLPSRYQYQHYFAVAPLMALAIAFWLRSRPADDKRYVEVFVVIALMCSLSPWHLRSGLAISTTGVKRPAGILTYADIPAMLQPRNWYCSKLRGDYALVTSVDGAILTLAPTGVLEAGGKILPAFATGPFAWRAAGILSDESAERYGFVTPTVLSRIFIEHPPAGIITGEEDEPLEKQFITLAQGLSYQALKMKKRRTLWTRLVPLVPPP